MFRNFINFLIDLYRNRSLLLQLTVRDFKSRYLGSYLGLLWAFINPVVTILIFWFVFQVGFKAAPVGDFPFILWLITGIIPWFFIAETFTGGTGAVVENSYLVKKIVFRVSMLPVVKLLSALVVHLFFVLVIFLVFAAYHIYPGLHALQVIYYGFSAIVLLLGLTWLTSSLMVFLKDVGQAVSTFIQFGFWLTPIFWSVEMVPEKYRVYLKLNPFFYITEGYRDSFVHKIWFWEHPVHTVYYWSITSVIFILGAVVFSRLRPHFADVL
ncbi:MAG: ABC transporter permease [Desulfuromonadaceae bacterium]|nr:ABC transporter permease [Desulfuromonadaceae bacterium]